MRIVRFAIVRHNPNEAWDTGATYPGCSRWNPDACVPLQFATIEEVKQYANQKNEVVYVVKTAEEAWQLVEHPESLPALPASFEQGIFSGDSSLLWIAAGALALFTLLPSRGRVKNQPSLGL